MEVSDELWASADWVPTSVDRHPWMRKNKAELEMAPENESPSRWFIPRGYQWPLLCVSVYETYPFKPVGVLVSVSYKGAADGWFKECSLPRALVSALIEMLGKIGK